MDILDLDGGDAALLDPGADAIEQDARPIAEQIDRFDMARIKPETIVRLIERGYSKMKWRRDCQKDAYRRILGREHGVGPQAVLEKADGNPWGGIASGVQITNLTAQHIRTLLVAVAYTAGLPDVEARYSQFEPEAEMHKSALQIVAERQNLDEKYQLMFVDACLTGEAFSITGLRAGNDTAGPSDMDTDMGELYEEAIAFEDVCIDPDAKRWEDRRFVARRTRISRARAIRERLYGRDPLNPEVINPHEITWEEVEDVLTRARTRDEAGDRSRATDMSGTDSSAGGSGRMDGSDVLEIWDVYWREGGKTFLISVLASPDDEENPAEAPKPEAAGGADRFLRVVELQCPEQGEIDRLCLFPPLHQMHPASLDAWQKDLAVVASAMSAKLALQSLNTKKTVFYQRSITDEVNLARKSPDLSYVACENPEAIKQFEMGGMLSDLIPALGWFNDQANVTNQQVNDPQGSANKTATAAQLLATKAQGYVEHMRQWVQRFATRNLRRRAWYLINDPNMRMSIPYRIDGTEYVQITYGPDVIEGKFDNFAFSIADGTMPYQDPAVQANVTLTFLSGPLDSIVQKMAMGILKPAAARVIARQLGIRNFDQIVNDIDLDQMRMQMMMMGPQNPKGAGGGLGGMQMGGMGMGMGAGVPAGNPQAAGQQAFRPGAGGPAAATRPNDMRQGVM